MDIELQSADAIENSSSQAAPGSAPFLTATRSPPAIHAQALTQKLLAAELRQEAARIAHRNTLRKENATNTTAAARCSGEPVAAPVGEEKAPHEETGQHCLKQGTGSGHNSVPHSRCSCLCSRRRGRLEAQSFPPAAPLLVAGLSSIQSALTKLSEAD